VTYPKSTGDNVCVFPQMSQSDNNFENYDSSHGSGSDRSKDDLRDDYHETEVLRLLDEEGFPRESFKPRQVANSDGKRACNHNEGELLCSASSSITDPQEQPWCSDSSKEREKRTSSHDDYSSGKIGVFSNRMDQLHTDPFKNAQRRTFCSQGCASPPQFMENFHPDVFSQDGKFAQNS
jgi:hypothetical protein